MKTPTRSTVFWASLFDLLSSMRFAIGLLTILAIASVIGTVLQQNQPYPNYMIEFGQFWFTVFEWLGLFDVYHSAWFLILLAFLVLSTSLCIWRNTPGFLKEMRGWRENASERSLAAMSHTTLLHGTGSPDTVQAYLTSQGFAVKTAQREDGSTMVVGKRGAGNKLGYFFAHIALVVICIGGLIDGNLPLKLGELFGTIRPETRDIPQGQVPAESRLSTSNLSFRGNVTIPENSSADVVFLNAGRGYLVQDLPFIITLKKFRVEYYPTGMPKLFASDIVITDKASGQTREETVKVNHPVHVDGVAIYQASFGDGGSPLELTAWNLAAPAMGPIKVEGRSMNQQPLVANGKPYSLEFGELRVFNIQDMRDNSTVAVNKTFNELLSQAQSVQHEKNLANAGPTIQFKLRDNQGQAFEYHTYMSPLVLEGRSYIVTGVRKEVGQPFSYLRLPLDQEGSLQSFMRLYATLHDTSLYPEIARRAAAKALAGSSISPEMQQQFQFSVEFVLNRFHEGGFRALDEFVQARVPADKQAEVGQTYIKILQAVVVDMMEIDHHRAGLAPFQINENNYRFLLDSLVAAGILVRDYGSPVFLQLSGFDQVQATGLQLTRSPGKNVVYFGSLILVLGILCMFYIREVRVWVRLGAQDTRLAVSSNRKNRDLEQDFARHQARLLEIVQGKA